MADLVALGKNFATGTLPEGCLFCRDGAKMVLYLTGDCQSHCFYCPVDEERMYVDRAFANEREIGPEDVNGAVEEAHAMRAAGVGITGGDPMMRPERVERFVSRFKKEFGPTFHCHMYTQNIFDKSWLARLEEAGLDEIRFHAPVAWWHRMSASPYDELIRHAVQTRMRVGFEVPAIPGKADALLALAAYADQVGASFVNLNELEFSQANIDQLISRGHRFENDESNTVAQSRQTARRVAKSAVHRGIRTVVHFCASTYKDDVQLRKRFLRRAANTERLLEATTPDGTLIFGVVEGRDVEAIHDRLVDRFAVDPRCVQIDHQRNRVDVAGWVLERYHAQLEDLGRSFIVEVHPSSTRLEVERTPLPYPDEP